MLPNHTVPVKGISPQSVVFFGQGSKASDMLVLRDNEQKRLLVSVCGCV